MDLLQTLIQNLEKGKKSAQQMRSLLELLQGSNGCGDDHHLCYKGVDDHSLVVLSSLDTALSVLQRSDIFNGDLITTAKKADFPDHHCKSEQESGGDTTPKNATSKERRGCYKRRKIGQSVTTMDTPNLTDDGFAWRKYGQKIILNAQHPRNYYRCTHKIDQGCQATKQVQQISENPTKYRIIYHGRHTCNNLNKNLQILLNSPEQEYSSIFLNFETNTTTAKHALNPFIFTSSPSSSSSAFASAMVKQEEMMMQSGPSDPHHGTYNQYSSSSDLTTTGLSSTPVSDQGEVYSSTARLHGMEEADYSYFMADDSISLDEVFLQDLLHD